MNKHTPGPWMVEPINGGETFQITTAESNHFTVVAETPVDGTGKDEANARLIAAAPDLLTLAQDFEAAFGKAIDTEDDIHGADAVDFICEYIWEVRAALKKLEAK